MMSSDCLLLLCLHAFTITATGLSSNPIITMTTPYQAPPGGLYVANPRTATDIVVRSLAIHCFAVCAYAQLTSLLSWTTNRRFATLPVLLFMLFPELVILQSLCYVCSIFIAGRAPPDQFASSRFTGLPEKNTELRLQNGDALETSYIANPGHGKGIKPDIEKLCEDPGTRALPSTLHLLFLIATSGPLIVTIVAYKQRLAIRYMAADYVGNLGLDHRNAWISIGGTVAASGSLAVILFKRSSTSRSAPSKSPIPNFDLGSVSSSVVFYEAGICSMLHHVLLAATNHATPLSFIRCSGTRPPLGLVCAGVLLYWRRPKWRSTCKMAAECLVILLVATTAGTQLFFDVQELHNVSQGRVQPYNYRWKVKDWGSGRSATT